MTSPTTEPVAAPVCPMCGRVFSTQRQLASHLKSHNDPTICPECGRQVRYLAPHLRRAHPLPDKEAALLAGVQELIEENRSLRQRLQTLEQHSPIDSPDSPHSPQT